MRPETIVSRGDNPAACGGGTARTGRSICGKPLRRWTRRYSSQRAEFYHAKQILGGSPTGAGESPAPPIFKAGSKQQTDSLPSLADTEEMFVAPNEDSALTDCR